MVREVNFTVGSMIGKPVAGKPVRFRGRDIGHIVSVNNNRVICAIDDDNGLISQLRSSNFTSVEVVKR